MSVERPSTALVFQASNTGFQKNLVINFENFCLYFIFKKENNSFGQQISTFCPYYGSPLLTITLLTLLSLVEIWLITLKLKFLVVLLFSNWLYFGPKI